MRDVYEIRRTNLRLLVDQWGGPKPLSKKLGYRNASFIVQMAGPHPTREVTERSARRIESVLDLPSGWMDSVIDPGNAQMRANLTQICTVIRTVAQEAEDVGIKLTPGKLSDIVFMVLSDAEQHGSIRPEYVKQLLQLMV